MLELSLNKQSEPYELILLDNTKNQFRSAAQALNVGARQAKGDNLVFVHQDVEFIDSHVLLNIHRSLELLYKNAIVGAAGIMNEEGVVTSIVQGSSKQPAGEIVSSTLTEVQTLDEVLIGMPRDVYEKLKFDEEFLHGWHLYGVDLCLRARSMGIKSYVIPLNCFHLSKGSLDFSYAKDLYRIIRKNRAHFPMIYTTCSQAPTSYFKAERYILRLIWDHVVVGRK